VPPEIPIATYRLQLTAAFGFREAAAIVPYLNALGISHLYASPFLKARAGSTHGYDIIDHSQLNPEFGGEAGFAALSEALARADMGLILDFVPNHMGVGHSDNAMWLDVLEWGPRSRYAKCFDIDWKTLPYRADGGVLIPILGRPYGEALEQGEIELRFDRGAGTFSCWYFDHRLPIRPQNYSEILRTCLSVAETADNPAADRIRGIAERFSGPRMPTQAHAPSMKAELAALGDAEISLIERGLETYRPEASQPSRVMLLHRLLERQHYRVAHWRVAVSEINYRRFFDINDLAGIRVEDADTFRLVHRKVAALVADNKVHGLRLDHIDGLYDPVQYCRRLSRLVRSALRLPDKRDFYIVVEKILSPGEAMLRLPGVAGTTGYDMTSIFIRVLLDSAGLPALERCWQTNAAPGRNYAQIVEEARALVISTTMASEFTVLSRLLARIAAGHWPTRDFTLDRLRAALELYVICFPGYRSYIAGGKVSAGDKDIVEKTIRRARERWYGSDQTIFDFLEDVITLRIVGPDRAGYSADRVQRFVSKLQQFTGPVTAKSVEDTSFYRYNRLLALNEVGNDPSLPGLSPAQFHEEMIGRARDYPHAMTATATHDTKRGEDARMRILALAELADEWTEAVARWIAINAGRIAAAPRRAPSRSHEYMIYQTLLGVWGSEPTPAALTERLQTYAIKATRESKQETSWINPNAEYEDAVKTFIAQLLDPAQSAEFQEDFDAFARRTQIIGALNSVSQLVLKATVPGVPDFYQGTEFWDFALVDPDNRRPVDFGRRQTELTAAAMTFSPGGPGDAFKLALTARLLSLRRRYATLFTNGDYRPIGVAGEHADHVLAFARVLGGTALIVAVGRHFASHTERGSRCPRGDDWHATLDLSNYSVTANLLGDAKGAADKSASIGDLFAHIPAAVLSADVKAAGLGHIANR
jgi:(1->4)-alpha-D-glucan 1-alpha-D-glucosylmutase